MFGPITFVNFDELHLWILMNYICEFDELHLWISMNYICEFDELHLWILMNYICELWWITFVNYDEFHFVNYDALW